MIYSEFYTKEKKLAVLIDPDKYTDEKLLSLLEYIHKIDFFLVGGSLMLKNVDHCISILKSKSNKPVILFPGSIYQLATNADALLLLSLISGRNPEFLIGNHVVASHFIRNSGLETIPTGYILIEGGKTSSVEYMSNTRPIPSDKIDLIVSTALAGELLGLKSIYLEAGSGALYPVPENVIQSVKQNINLPIIVGGGIRNAEQIDQAWNAGADIVVVGNGIEQNPALLKMIKIV